MIINKLVAKIHTTLTYRTRDSFEEAVSFFCLTRSRVLVPVHERDLYGHLGGIFACMGPVNGPVQAPQHPERVIVQARQEHRVIDWFNGPMTGSFHKRPQSYYPCFRFGPNPDPRILQHQEGLRSDNPFRIVKCV